jgi:mono/diheme cytochrome c family protein
MRQPHLPITGALMLMTALVATPFVTATAATATATATATTAAQDPLVRQGRYVARAADCFSCHTAPGGRTFAGGDELKTPFGPIYAPNITQDPNTGIGRWSESDFTRALRLGVRPDGKLLYPAMPYAAYTKMSDADLKALWAFMRTVPAVAHAVEPPEKTLHFPFNVRADLAAWQALYFKPGPWQPDSSKSYAWNRGSYLVQALGHCSECHTPRNLAQAPKRHYELTGAQLQGWYAPDISTDAYSKITHYDVPELAHFFRTGHLPDNTTAFGPMREAIHDSLRYLSEGDLEAVATYLKNAPTPDLQSTERVRASAAQIESGRRLYGDHCASCHGTDGHGVSGEIPSLDGNSAVTAAQGNDLVMAMLQGFTPHGTYGAMGSFARDLDDAQIADIANYVRTAWSNHAEPNVLPWSVGNWRAVADIPAKSREPALICPLLAKHLMEPALADPPELLRRAATDRHMLSQVVHRYVTARPEASSAEVIEALSSAYCRAVVSEHVSAAQSSARIASFTQELAIALTPGRS